MADALEAALGPIAEQAQPDHDRRRSSARDLISQALILILVGSLGILLWITLPLPRREVRRRPRSSRCSTTSSSSSGIFAILGTFFRVQIDALFVTAMLTVIGFSVHDTIVVFDRIRENRARHAGEPFAEIVNHSILQTFGRSITTSLTVVLTLLALLLFGGAAIDGLRARPADRHRLRDLLVDLQREPAARRLARLGRPPQAVGPPRSRPRSADPPS